MGIEGVAGETLLHFLKIEAQILRNRHHLVLGSAHLILAPAVLAGQSRQDGLTLTRMIRVQFKGMPLEAKFVLRRQLFHGLLQAGITNRAPGAGDVGNNVDVDRFHGISRSLHLDTILSA